MGGASLAQGGDGDGLLLLHDELVLFRGRLGLEALPGETPLEEVDEDVSDGLEVVATRLLHSQVIVDGGITGGTRKGPPLALGNVLQRPRMPIPLTQTKINTVNEVATPPSPIRDKVGRFNIPMDKVPRMHQLHPLQHLIRNHEDRFEGEAPSAFVELIFERRSEEIHDHEVVGVLGAEVVDFGESGGILEFAVDFVFVAELGAARSVLFELHCNL